MITLFDSKDSITERFAQKERIARKWIKLPDELEEFPQTTRAIPYRNLLKELSQIDSPEMFAMWYANNPIDGAVEYWLKSHRDLDERFSNQILLGEILGKPIELSSTPNMERYKPDTSLTEIFDQLGAMAPIEITPFKKTRSTWLYSTDFAPTTYGDLFDRINPNDSCPLISWGGFCKIWSPESAAHLKANELDSAIVVRVGRYDCVLQLEDDKLSWYTTSWGKSTTNSELAALLGVTRPLVETELFFGGECVAKSCVLNRPLFLFFLLNTPPFNKICAVDEAILERKKNSIYLYFFPNKKFVTAHLSQVGPNLLIKIHKVASTNLQTYFVRFLSVLLSSYLANEDAIAQYYRAMKINIKPVVPQAEEIAKELTLFQQEPEIFRRFYPKMCLNPPKIVGDDEPGLEFPTIEQAARYNVPIRKYACKDPVFKYIGIRSNDLENKDKFPCVPCCYDNDQMTKKSKLVSWLQDGTCSSEESRVRGVMLTQKILMPGAKGELPPLLSKIFGVIYGPDRVFLRTQLLQYDSRGANVWMWDDQGLVMPRQLPVYYDLAAPYMHIYKNFGNVSNKQMLPSFEVIIDKATGKFLHTDETSAQEFLKLANLSWAREIDGVAQESIVFEPRVREPNTERESPEFAAWVRNKKLSRNILWNAIWCVASACDGDPARLEIVVEPEARVEFQQLLPNKTLVRNEGRTLVIPEPVDVLGAIKSRDFEQVPKFIPDYYETRLDFNSPNVLTVLPPPTGLSESSTPGDEEFWFAGWYAIRQSVDSLPANCLVATLDKQIFQLGDGGTTKWLVLNDKQKKIFYKLFCYKKE